jgi:hypothetical protein
MVKLTEVEDEHFREEQQGPPPTKGDHTLVGADDEEDDDFTDTGIPPLSIHGPRRLHPPQPPRPPPAHR